MKCLDCKIEMKRCKHGVTVGSLIKGTKMTLYECPKCKRLEKVKEKVTF